MARDWEFHQPWRREQRKLSGDEAWVRIYYKALNEDDECCEGVLKAFMCPDDEDMALSLVENDVYDRSENHRVRVLELVIEPIVLE